MFNKEAPAGLPSPEARTTKGHFMAKTSVVDERRIRRILAEAEDRFDNELLPDEERLLLLDRIRRLRRAVETAAQTIDAQHSGLDQL